MNPLALIAMFSSGVNSLNSIRRSNQQRYVQAQTQMMSMEKYINDLDLTEGLNEEHARYYNNKIDNLNRQLVTLSQQKGWARRGFSSDEQYAINAQFKQLAKEIQMVKANDQDYAKKAEEFRKNREKYDPDVFAEGSAIYFADRGQHQANVLSPAPMNVLEAIVEGNKTLSSLYSKPVQIGNEEVSVVNPLARDLAWEELKKSDPGRQGLVNAFLTKEEDIRQFLPEINQYANAKGIPAAMMQNYTQEINMYLKTGYSKYLTKNPVIQGYVADYWGEKNIKPMIAPDIRTPIEKKELTQAEIDRVPFTVYGDVVAIKDPIVIPDENGYKMEINRIKNGKASGIKYIPAKDDESAKIENVEIPITKISKDLYTKAPWLEQVVPSKNYPQDPPPPPTPEQQRMIDLRRNIELSKAQTIKFKDAGKIYNIPSSEAENFLKDHPNAQRI